ncbi:CaiB/BaiF CoA-transferase family protein [Achromobacter xylosoxidans]|uniref:CaiB/BaiF CoA-transferase family protein n=1 Tax=Alcaligenes xylosoxydans xylosoxydans TaxID=85698 RepID=UPI001EED1DF9|nr:CoA transferase [Achromobacter xylosoxidans]
MIPQPRDSEGKTEPAPLASMRVIDLVHGPLGAIGRHLAELGADVIRVEPRAGGSDRHCAPVVDGVSLAYVAANLGKKSVALDIAAPGDAVDFDRLLNAADVLMYTRQGAPSLDPAVVRARFPHLVVLTASDFGSGNTLEQWQATDPVVHALSAELSRSGIPGRPPLLPPGELSYACAAPQAVFSILVAYYNRMRGGGGDWLDFSLLEGAMHTLDPGYGMAGSATAGVPASKLPRGRPEARFQYPIVPCRDGFVRLCVLAPRQWQGMFKWMGSPEEFADPSYNSLRTRFTSTTLIPVIARLFAERTRQELEEEGQAHGVPVAAVLSLDEALRSPQIQARGVFSRIDLGQGLSAPYPDGIIEIDGRRAGIRGTAPALGQHQPELSAFLERAPLPSLPAAARPLEGVRVLDFGVIVAGAEAGRLLADQGADVWKVENAAFPDGARQSQTNDMLSVTFAAGSRNKRGLGLNLRTPQGKALFLKLVASADVLLSNFKPGTLDSLGLGRDVLRQANPRLVMADSSAFGPTGPWSQRLGYGPLVRASSGLAAQWCYPGDPTSFADAITVYPDHVAARIVAIGALSLLIRRARTGRGGTASVAQNEVMLSHLAIPIAAQHVEKDGRPLSGISMPTDAPWGVFPSRGDDDWIVVTVRNDTDWRAMTQVIGRADLLTDPELAHSRGRAAQRERVEQALRPWLAGLGAAEAAERLQAAGVPAAPMLRVSELPAHPYFQERHFFRLTHHPLIPEPFHLECAPVKSQRLPDPPNLPAPLLGEHTVEILREVAGLTDAELAQLAQDHSIDIAAAP